MPRKLRPIEDTAAAALPPGQVNMAHAVEVGPELVDSGVSCDPRAVSVGIAPGVSKLPITVAYDTVHRRIAEATVEFGEQSNTQTRVLIGMEQGIYAALKEKDKLVEVGTSGIGAKQYLLKRGR